MSVVRIEGSFFCKENFWNIKLQRLPHLLFSQLKALSVYIARKNILNLVLVTGLEEHHGRSWNFFIYGWNHTRLLQRLNGKKMSNSLSRKNRLPLSSDARRNRLVGSLAMLDWALPENVIFFKIFILIRSSQKFLECYEREWGCTSRSGLVVNQALHQ